jgi:hypothetical protein
VRFALLSFVATGVVLFACSTFSGSGDDSPPPAPDAGPDVTPDADSCNPVVAQPGDPPTCTADLQSDADNCGACGHRCIDTKCVTGKCESELLTPPLAPFAIDGTAIYMQVGQDLHVADLTKRPVTFELFRPTLSGTVQYLEVYGRDLYIGSTSDQTILDLDTKLPRHNTDYDAVKTAVVDGHFFPGASEYYLFADPVAGQHLARIQSGSGSVDYKQANGFEPVARSGNDFYWTETLTGGVNLFGPWEATDRIVSVATKVEAFAAEGATAYFAGGGHLSRATRGAPVTDLAIESGTGVAFAVDGEQLYYVVRRESPDIRWFVFKIDKCKGGPPVPLFDQNKRITGIYLNEPQKMIVNTESGLFRFTR